MLGIEKILSGFAPKKALDVLRANIETRLSHEVDAFEMRLFCEDHKIDFLIYLPERVPFSILPPEVAYRYNNEKRCNLYKFTEGEQLSKIVMYTVKDKLPDDYSLQYLIIKYNRNGAVICEAYGLKENVKQKQTIQL